MNSPHHTPPNVDLPSAHSKGLGYIMELFDVSAPVAITTFISLILVISVSTYYFIHSAPPTHITISTGPEGSVFHKNAVKYQKILEKNGVKVNILNSNGSLQNLERLVDLNSHVDIGFAQGGITPPGNEKLISLGSISYQPLMLFYRGKNLSILSELKGRKVSIGPEGSGTRKFALAILALNGIDEKNDHDNLVDWESDDAIQGLYHKKIDAAFVMSENASTEKLHDLLRSTEIHLYHFKQANAYSRKIEFLNILDLPEGSIELGKNIPAQDITLLGPMVEIIAKKDLHPAISDLILEAATQIHNHPGTYQKRGDFPNLIEHSIPISADATRFHQSGKSWVYRIFPFWLASLLSRIAVVFIPAFVVLIPILKSIPAFFRWRMQRKIHRHYRNLLILEQKILNETNSVKQEKLHSEFDQIEAAVNQMKIAPAFADQFYGLRGHIDYVRELVMEKFIR